MDYPKLLLELKNDPLGRGYSGMSNTQAATSLNTANRTYNVPSIPSQDIIEATVGSEYVGLSASNREIYWGMLAGGTVDPSGPRTRAIYNMLFPSGSTRDNLVGLATCSISRAAELGLGEVMPGHVGKARTLGGSPSV